MLLNASLSAQNRLRYLLFAAIAIVGTLVIWTTHSLDGKQLTSTVGSWPAAVASHFMDDKGDSNNIDRIPTSNATTDSMNPPHFILIGDSTTRGQAEDGGGWGDAFLWLLSRGATGVNHGINGALSTGYYGSPTWKDAMQEVRQAVVSRAVYVTIQVRTTIPLTPHVSSILSILCSGLTYSSLAIMTRRPTATSRSISIKRLSPVWRKTSLRMAVRPSW